MQQQTSTHIERTWRAMLVLAALCLVMPGCMRMRNHYRYAADRDTSHVLLEKTGARPWYLPRDYSVVADPRSRLFDPTNPNDPALPPPGPYLYAYQLPRFAESSGGSSSSSASEASPKPAEDIHPKPLDTSVEVDPQPDGDDDGGPRTPTALAVYQVADGPEDLPAPTPVPPPYADADEGLTIQPIPAPYWDALPRQCMLRMLEFASVRDEYQRTFGVAPPDSLRDSSPKLTFKNIVELGYLNSREYQTQKELLYSTALALTLERYDYVTKFSLAGNGVDVNYDHIRADGTSVSTLGTPSSLRTDKMIALGGTVVTQFANNVLLTFDGPQGFARDINTNLLFDFTQSVFQRDVLLNPLIQSERNVVYAARSFARFRKQFFFDLAQTYYLDLLSNYRQIEIDTQNYTALVRALDQAESEVQSGVGDAPPRVQIDQIEQRMLEGRRDLINTCNRLETSLDRLKLTLGLPTETPININLRELEMLTLRDEIEVAQERVRRAHERVETQLSSELPDREELLSAAVVLLERVLDWLELRKRGGTDVALESELRELRAQLRVDEAYESLDRAQRQLAIMKGSMPPTAAINVFRGTMIAVQARLDLTARQLQLADELQQRSALREGVLARYLVLTEQTDSIRTRVARFLRGESEALEGLLTAADTILQELVQLDATARDMVGRREDRPEPRAAMRQTIEQAQQILETTDRLAAEVKGLSPIEISADDAMVTALVQRFELMNERGLLADDWRRIKLAADDLKSVLNLNVRQSYDTRNLGQNGFGFDDLRTELRGSLDLPLNRRQQRNAFRQSLMDYQAGRRDLMELEDGIKFSTRQDLRQLSLDRVQYDISVVSAALASERVYSTQLELALGLGSVTARDFLEAQAAYQGNLIAVANRRFGYIVNRAQLALDMELMLLDDTGFWPELTNESYQPRFDPIFPRGAGPTYGTLPHAVWPSKKIKRMWNYPLPGFEVGGIGRGDSESEDSSGRRAEPTADPQAENGNRSKRPETVELPGPMNAITRP